MTKDQIQSETNLSLKVSSHYLSSQNQSIVWEENNILEIKTVIKKKRPGNQSRSQMHYFLILHMRKPGSGTAHRCLSWVTAEHRVRTMFLSEQHWSVLPSATSQEKGWWACLPDMIRVQVCSDETLPTPIPNESPSQCLHQSKGEEDQLPISDRQLPLAILFHSPLLTASKGIFSILCMCVCVYVYI